MPTANSSGNSKRYWFCEGRISILNKLRCFTFLLSSCHGVESWFYFVKCWRFFCIAIVNFIFDFQTLPNFKGARFYFLYTTYFNFFTLWWCRIQKSHLFLLITQNYLKYFLYCIKNLFTEPCIFLMLLFQSLHACWSEFMSNQGWEKINCNWLLGCNY